MEETILPVTEINYTDSLNAIITNQNTIIEQNEKLLKIGEDVKFLKEHFEITEQEQEELDKAAIKEKEQYTKEVTEFIKTSLYSEQLQDIKTELKQLNNTGSDTLDVSATTSTTSYLLLFGVVAITVCYAIGDNFRHRNSDKRSLCISYGGWYGFDDYFSNIFECRRRIGAVAGHRCDIAIYQLWRLVFNDDMDGGWYHSAFYKQ